MFRRLILEQWASVIAVISFCFFFIVFAYATVRALRMAEKNRDHLASMPLDSPEDRARSLHTNQ
jgi:hypothetical protein